MDNDDDATRENAIPTTSTMMTDNGGDSDTLDETIAIAAFVKTKT